MFNLLRMWYEFCPLSWLPMQFFVIMSYSCVTINSTVHHVTQY
uniref:Uncharacterized protein n=1 Tax=Rhizophora mucronata TaxID=61149 RepID=A0A2P2QT90_RHIMU